MADTRSTSRFLQSLRQRTAARRSQRNRRKRTYVLIGFLLLAVLIVAAPSIASRTSMVKSLVIQRLAGYGLDLEVERLEFGWITPVVLEGVTIAGASQQTHARLERLETDLRLLDLFPAPQDWGVVRIRGVEAELTVADGSTSLEDDFAALLFADSNGPAPHAEIILQNASITVTDAGSQTQWFLSNIETTTTLAATRTQLQGSAVVTDPRGASGAVEFGAVVESRGGADVADVADAASMPGTAADDGSTWKADVQLRDVPLHLITLLKRRFPETAGALPDQLRGDASGLVRLSSDPGGAIKATFEAVELRKLVAADSRLGDRVWSNDLAQIDGRFEYAGGVVQADPLRAATDFGRLDLIGRFPLPESAFATLRWLESISGQGTIEVDLAKLQRAAPGLLPLRDEATLESGNLAAMISAGVDRDQKYRTVCSLKSTGLRGVARGRPVVIEPVNAELTLALQDGAMHAERVSLTSAFGQISGNGDLRNGRGDFRLDFDRLAAILRPLVRLPDAGLRGSASGQIEWTIRGKGPAGEVWRCDGDLHAKNLNLQLPGGGLIRQPELTSQVFATGVWNGSTLSSLQEFQAQLRSQGQQWQVDLKSPVEEPLAGNLLPLKVRGSGQLKALQEMLSAWLPATLRRVEGNFDADFDAELGRSSGRIVAASLDVQQPRVLYQQQEFRQPFAKLRFAGDGAWPTMRLKLETLTLETEALTAAAAGFASPTETDIEFGWRTDLQRVQRSLRTMPSQPAVAAVQQAAYVPSATSTQPYQFAGRCEGSATLHGEDDLWSIDTDTRIENLAIRQPAGTTPVTGPVRPGVSQPAATKLLWSEPSANIRGIFRYDSRTGGAMADHVKIATAWLETTVDGHLIWNDFLGEVSLKGPSTWQLPEVANRLSSLSDQPIELTGTHQTPLYLLLQRRSDGSISAEVETSIGWQTGKVAGVGFGASQAPIRVTESVATISPTTIPLDVGRVHIDAQVHYGSGTLWIQQNAGRFTENLRLDPETSRRWLKYVAPLAADATEIDGTLDVDLSECIIVPSDARASRVAGQLAIRGIDLNAGPLANQFLLGIDQIKNLTRGMLPGQATPRTRKLMTIPAQVVDFQLSDGVVQHSRLFLDIDDARVVTSGTANVNGQLNLMAQVPLQADWLGSDVRSLANQSVSIPVRGTFSQPRLDTRGITQTLGNLGVQAAQQGVQDYLQDQVNRGLERLLGR